MSVHDGHRERMKKRFLEHGLDNFDDVNALELLLFYTLPRSDTNPIAHALLERFGSLSGVLNAPAEELVKVSGITENSAVLLKLIPQLGRRYLISCASMDNVLTTTEEVGQFLLPYFVSEKEEVVYLLSMDAKMKVLSCHCISRGSLGSAAFSIRRVVEAALSDNAACVVLAHNHTSGVALPSQTDEETTLRLFSALLAVDIVLIDHIVVANNDFVSFADNGFFKKLRSDHV